MKKALSVLLIAAAIFGFYGSAVNLNDVLACKDYWEKAGEESTANMNKLEDGLNQLKENEQAYLDGKDQLAEGEAALADGEAQYAAGQAQLAQGEADYAAAPAKLAAGEAQLAEGKQSYKDLITLINGLNTAKKHGTVTTKNHDVYWSDAFENSLRPGRQQIVKGLKDPKVALLETLTGKKDLAKKASSASDYRDFDNVVTKTLIPTFNDAAKKLDGFADIAEDKAGTLDTAQQAYAGLKQLEAAWSVEQEKLGGQSLADVIGPLNAKNEKAFLDSPYANAEQKQLLGFFTSDVTGHPYYSAVPATTLLLGGVGQQMSDFLGSDNGKMLQGIAASGDASKAANKDASLADKVAALVQGMTALSGLTGQDAADGPTFEAVAPQVVAGLEDAADLLRDSAKEARNNAGLFQKWHEGYDTLNDGKNNQLASQSSGLPYAFKNMATNKTIKAAVKKYDKSLMKELKKYKGTRLRNEGFVAFDKDLVHISKDVIPRALKVLGKVKGSAEKQLADGKAQLAQGYADYKAAPGKLAEGRAKLADAEQQLADGRQQLADGKAQLAQYEDGEQQVRDGLATLVGTEPDLDLEGIASRLNGDTDFDNGDDHLDLDEGLNAVEVGRGYQADDGVLITDEIMARAVGTGALLGAGVLAVLAAILSFLKKNKGAGIFAILAAAAGAFGAFYGTNAGTYFSDIAGSTAGNAAWIAAGVLGAVALVHAIVHFAAPKNA